MTAAVIGHRRRMVRLVSVETAVKKECFQFSAMADLHYGEPESTSLLYTDSIDYMYRETVKGYNRNFVKHLGLFIKLA